MERIRKWIESASNRKIFFLFFSLTLLLYAKTIGYLFIEDDRYQIIQNPVVHQLSTIPQLFTVSTFIGGVNNNAYSLYYRPIMTLAYTLLYVLGGGGPAVFHLFSILLHCLNTFLLFIFLKKLFLQRKNEKQAHVYSFLIAFVFLIHPVNVESVAYIAAVMELLYFCFFILGLLLVMRLSQREKIKNIDIFWIGLCFLCSLLSKETGIMFIPISMTFWILFIKKQLPRFFLPMLSILFLVYLYLRYIVAHIPLASAIYTPLGKMPLLIKLETIPFILFSYIRLFFLPLDLFHPQYQVITTVSDYRFNIFLPIVVVIVSLYIIFARIIRSGIYTFFLIWTICFMGMLTNFITLDFTIAERWLYGPLVGLLGMTLLIVEYILSKKKNLKKICLYLFFIIMIFFFVRSWVRISNWQSEVVLFGHELSYVPDNCDLRVSYAAGLMGKKEMKQARDILLEKYKECSHNSSFTNNLGSAYVFLKDYDHAEHEFKRGIVFNVRNQFVYLNLAKMYLQQEKATKAIPILISGKKKYPTVTDFNYLLGLAYYQDHQKENAIMYLQSYYATNPSQDLFDFIQAVAAQQVSKSSFNL